MRRFPVDRIIIHPSAAAVRVLSAEVLETVVRTVHQRRTKLTITHYELFLLRDGDSERPDMGAQFGLVLHDYALKPAFGVYRRLIAEFGNDT